MKSRIASLLFVLGSAGAAAGAHAEGFSQKSSLVVFGGGNSSMPGSIMGQTVVFSSGDTPGTTTYDALKFEDVYRNDYNLGTEFDYAFTPQLTLFGRYDYSSFTGKNQQLGEFTSDSNVTTPVHAAFSDTDTHELDVGGRYTFMPSSRFQPFVGLALGAEHLGATHADFEDVDGLGETRVKLGEAEDVFHQRAEAGLQYAASENFGFRLSVAASHVNTETKSNDPNLEMVGLGPIVSHSADHWDYPIELGAVANF